MPESCFELVYSRQQVQIKEFYRFIFFKQPRSIVLVILMCVGGLINLAVGFLLRSIPNLFCGLLLLLFILLRVRRYSQTIKNTFKRQFELHGDEPKNFHAALYNDYFTLTDAAGAKVTVSYRSIKRCYQTKTAFLLHSRTNLAYCFPKDAFVKGLPECFIPFIRSRGIKAK